MKSKITQFKLWNQFIIAAVILISVLSNKVLAQSNPTVNTLIIGAGGILSDSEMDLKIQSNDGCNDNPQNNTIINGQSSGVIGKVGIGTFSPVKKLHIQTSAGLFCATSPGGGGGNARSGSAQPNGLRIEDISYTLNTNLEPIVDGNSTWDFEPVIGGSSNDPSSLYIGTPNSPKLTILSSGKVGIGITNPDKELQVCGTIKAKEVIVNLTGCDFVFEKNYKLMPLKELAIYIEKNKHLPEVAPAKEMETAEGVLVGEMQSKLLQKVEELTLYMIQVQKENEELKHRLEILEKH